MSLILEKNEYIVQSMYVFVYQFHQLLILGLANALRPNFLLWVFFLSGLAGTLKC